MSKSFESFWRRLAARTPFAAELSVNMQVPLAVCRWLSLDSAAMMGNSCWLPMKIPPVYDSAAEETTFCRVLQMSWMAPLSGGRPVVEFMRYKMLTT